MFEKAAGDYGPDDNVSAEILILEAEFDAADNLVIDVRSDVGRRDNIDEFFTGLDGGSCI